MRNKNRNHHKITLILNTFYHQFHTNVNRNTSTEALEFSEKQDVRGQLQGCHEQNEGSQSCSKQTGSFEDSMRRKLRLTQTGFSCPESQLTFQTYIVVLEDMIDTTKPNSEQIIQNRSYSKSLNATVVRTT